MVYVLFESLLNVHNFSKEAVKWKKKISNNNSGMTGLTIEDELFPTSPSHLYEPNIVNLKYKVFIGRIINTLEDVRKVESLDGPSA